VTWVPVNVQSPDGDSLVLRLSPSRKGVGIDEHVSTPVLPVSGHPNLKSPSRRHERHTLGLRAEDSSCRGLRRRINEDRADYKPLASWSDAYGRCRGQRNRPIVRVAQCQRRHRPLPSVVSWLTRVLRRASPLNVGSRAQLVGVAGGASLVGADMSLKAIIPGPVC